MLLGEGVVPLLASACWDAVAAVWELVQVVAVPSVLSVLGFAVLCYHCLVGVVLRALVPKEPQVVLGTVACTVCF